MTPLWTPRDTLIAASVLWLLLTLHAVGAF